MIALRPENDSHLLDLVPCDDFVGHDAVFRPSSNNQAAQLRRQTGSRPFDDEFLRGDFFARLDVAAGDCALTGLTPHLQLSCGWSFDAVPERRFHFANRFDQRFHLPWIG